MRDGLRPAEPSAFFLPIAAMEVIRSRGVTLPFNVEVLGFSEEEGVRFSSAYLGSKGYTGRLRKSDLNLRDADGISVVDALRRHNGRAFVLPSPAHGGKELLGYLEGSHRAGPRSWRRRSLPTGVVPAIAGQTRAKVISQFTGMAGHAEHNPDGASKGRGCRGPQTSSAWPSRPSRVPVLRSWPQSGW